MGKENREDTFFLLPVCTKQEREDGIHVFRRVSNRGVSNTDGKIMHKDKSKGVVQVHCDTRLSSSRFWDTVGIRDVTLFCRPVSEAMWTTEVRGTKKLCASVAESNRRSQVAFCRRHMQE